MCMQCVLLLLYRSEEHGPWLRNTPTCSPVPGELAPGSDENGREIMDILENLGYTEKPQEHLVPFIMPSPVKIGAST